MRERHLDILVEEREVEGKE